MKKRLIYLSIIIVPLLAVYWFYTHSFVEISLANVGGGEVIYQIKDQRSGKAVEAKTAESKVKRLVRRGSHEVLVENGAGSYFSVTSTGGWLGTAKVSASTEPENNRQFIGNNPAECMSLVSGVLVSSACVDNFANVEAHLPASESLPTRVRKIAPGLDGIVEGVFETAEGSFALVQLSDQSGHFLYPLGSLGAGPGIAANGLKAGASYRALPYRNGFVAISETGDDAFYYASVAAQAERIEISRAKANNGSLRAYDFDAGGESLAILLGDPASGANDPHTEEFEREARREGSSETEILVYQSGKARHFAIENERPRDIRLCGAELCLLRETDLEVFDMTGDKLTLKYRVGNVNALEVIGGDIILVRESEVLNLSAATGAGFVSYHTDGYGTCGLNAAGNNYLLCVANARAKQSALLINRSSANGDNIDKKIAELARMSEIKDISIYQNYIFISPELGSLSYIASEGAYGYDPATVSRVNEAINRKIDELQIDRTRYKIINNFE